MHKRNGLKTSLVCHAGVVNQAIITNVTAILFVPFMRLYGFTYVQLGLLTAAGFAAQLCADFLLLFFIDRFSPRLLACIAASLSCMGLIFYGLLPYICTDSMYFLIITATILFAFAGGMLEVVLSNAAEALPKTEGGGLCLLHTVYAWAQVGLALFLLGFFSVFGAGYWNVAVLLLAIVPATVLLLLMRTDLPKTEKHVSVLSAFHPFYLFAVLAVFFGYGAEVVMNQWISSFAASTFGAETGAAVGCALFAACLGGGGTLYVFAERRKNKPPIPLLIGSALAACAMYLLAALVDVPMLGLVFAILCGAFVGVLSPGAMSAAADFLPKSGGWLLASLALSQDIGAAVLPAVSGAITQANSMRAAFFVLSAVPLAAAVCLFVMLMMRRKKSGLRGVFGEK